MTSPGSEVQTVGSVRLTQHAAVLSHGHTYRRFKDGMVMAFCIINYTSSSQSESLLAIENMQHEARSMLLNHMTDVYLMCQKQSSHTVNVCLQSTPLDLIETGKGLKFQAERPHLVSLGSGRLSTAITLLPLPEGESTALTPTVTLVSSGSKGYLNSRCAEVQPYRAIVVRLWSLTLCLVHKELVLH